MCVIKTFENSVLSTYRISSIFEFSGFFFLLLNIQYIGIDLKFATLTVFLRIFLYKYFEIKFLTRYGVVPIKNALKKLSITVFGAMEGVKKRMHSNIEMVEMVFLKSFQKFHIFRFEWAPYQHNTFKIKTVFMHDSSFDEFLILSIPNYNGNLFFQCYLRL